MKAAAAPQRDLVLVGGGHSHALALRALAMKPPSGLRITLISDGTHTPYSGMLPGLIAGHYSFEDTHIDLDRFCARLGVRFLAARVTGIDRAAAKVLLADRPAVGYDFLSINIGSQPDMDSVEGARQYALPVKPVSGLYRRWRSIESRLADTDAGKGQRMVVVGGGAGSVELALAMAHRLQQSQPAMTLVCGNELLEGYNARALRAVREALSARSIDVLEHGRVREVHAESLSFESGGELPYDELVWCTSATAPDWLRESGLACDERGFLQVEDTLRVCGEERVFAAGDIAVQVNHPRPKAGVYAVRQAPVLAKNLRAALTGKLLSEHRPQRHFLSLLSLGDRRAVADRGMFSACGHWVWRWKDRIDRGFMARFTSLPARMPSPDTEDEIIEPMYCGGCGAKLPGSMLHEVLAELATNYPQVVRASDLGDDAAVVDWPSASLLLQSVDTLRALVDDPWLMGRITVLHALSDLFAMNARPHSALANITLPHAAERLQARDLQQCLDGAAVELAAAGCRLIGGHSLEGPEFVAGFTVNGEGGPGTLLRKTTVAVGDQLILSKSLGTGVLFAARQQGLADGRWIATALETMLQSNAAAAGVAAEYSATACTDITGFGLLGHLLEMLGRGSLQAVVSASSLPLLEGVAECFDAGVESSLHAANFELVAARLETRLEADAARLKAAVDPQTSGGLLLAVPRRNASAALQSLQESGSAGAALIGEIREAGSTSAGILLTD